MHLQMFPFRPVLLGEEKRKSCNRESSLESQNEAGKGGRHAEAAVDSPELPVVWAGGQSCWGAAGPEMNSRGCGGGGRSPSADEQ